MIRSSLSAYTAVLVSLLPTKHMHPWYSRASRARAVLLLPLLAACGERGSLVSPDPSHPAGPPRAPLAEIRCVVSVDSGALECGAPAAGGARGVILGGQNQYVKLGSSTGVYNAADSTFSANVRVQNLIPQPLGTANGYSSSPEGVRVFFTQLPTVVVGSGTAAVANATGTGTFTAAGQPYFEYARLLLGADSILSTNEFSSSRRWVFKVGPGVTSFQFQVYVTADVPHPDGWVEVTPGTDTVDVGDTVRFTAVVKSVVGAVIPDAPVTWSSDGESVLGVSADGLMLAAGTGSADVIARSGPREGLTRMMVCGGPPMGGVEAISYFMSDFCLVGRPGGARYALTGGFLVSAGNAPLPVTVTGTAAQPAPAFRVAPTAARGQGSRALVDVEREWAANARVRLAALRLGPPAVRAPARRAAVESTPAVGDRMRLYTGQSCAADSSTRRTGFVEAVTAHAVVVADSTNPADGLGRADYEAVAQRFETVVWPAVTGAFGEPADIDGNGRVVLFYTRAVNERTPAGSIALTGGFFFRLDLYPRLNCGGGNGSEMLYLAVADPSGVVNGTPLPRATVLGIAGRTQAHHLQHLVNASRRLAMQLMANTFEDPWLDEGMSAVAQELAFYRAAGLSPRANLGAADVLDGGAREAAFYEFMTDNLRNYLRYVRDPVNRTLWAGNDASGATGAAWSFLRYADDRAAPAGMNVWARLMDAPEPGIPTHRHGTDNLSYALNLENEFHALAGWLEDWQVATHADDLVPAGPAQAIYRMPSWNLRSIFTAPGLDASIGSGGTFPLAVQAPASGVASSVSIAPGGAAYWRFTVPEGERVFVNVHRTNSEYSPWATMYAIGEK